MIKDRGNIKWQGMMLTEHTNMLKDWKKANDLVQRPDLVEWELTLLAEEIERAFKSKASVKLTYWKDGKLVDDYGKIITIINKEKSIVFDDSCSTTNYKFEDIIKVAIID